MSSASVVVRTWVNAFESAWQYGNGCATCIQSSLVGYRIGPKGQTAPRTTRVANFPNEAFGDRRP